jgi:acid stress-induced BolA-like protein IbaG/YrbA
MRSIISIAAFAALASAAPTNSKHYKDFSPDSKYFPLANGFPTPSPDAVATIQKQAFGTLPNGPAPAKISAGGIQALKLIALNEIFEVAYFTELAYNITNKAPGYDVGKSHDYVLATINAIIAQEELHALYANGALAAFKEEPIQACKYNFPVSDFKSAIALAGTFTDLVLGTLQEVNTLFATNGDLALVGPLSSVIGNEAEQEGFFRLVQQKRATSQAFLTVATPGFAYTAVASFIVPGSCPNAASIGITPFKPLNLLSSEVKAKTQKLPFSFAKADAGTEDYSTLSVAYINSQNVPVVVKLEQVKVEGDKVTFEANFPYDQYLLNGLTIAAVTKGAGPFANADAVAAATIFGPGLIEIN